MKGKFITFEGSEGCGKSTQSRLLYEYLKKKLCKVVYLREPGGTRISERIREILLDPENHMEPETEMLLYMASRAQAVKEIIKRAILKGKIVVCDRFLDSTIAYQGYGLGIGISDIKCIGDFATIGIRPDITILLDLPVHQGLKYRKFSKDRIERRSYLYHLRVRRGYLKLAAQEPKRIKIVKVAEDKNLTQQKIRDLIEKYVI
jgi:dTMP kinase